MARQFKFTNVNSDVYVVGNSQLENFKGKDRQHPDHGMNISMKKGASILDCLDECAYRYQHKKDKVKLLLSVKQT